MIERAADALDDLGAPLNAEELRALARPAQPSQAQEHLKSMLNIVVNGSTVSILFDTAEEAARFAKQTNAAARAVNGGAGSANDVPPFAIDEVLQWLNEAMERIPSSLTTVTVTT